MKDEFEIKEIYRALVFVAAHLHLINDNDVSLRNDYCHSTMLDDPFYKRNIRVWVFHFKFPPMKLCITIL